MAIDNPHSNSIFSIRVESFYCTVTIAIHHLLKDLLSLHLHTNTVLQLIFQVLVRQMDETKEELAVRRKQVEDPIIQGKVGAVNDLLRYALHVTDEPKLFLQVWLGLKWINE